MNFKKSFQLILLLTIISIITLAQQPSGKEYRRNGIHNGNLVRTIFGNWGVVGQPADKGPRGAWLHDNNGYIGDVSPLFGVELEALNNIGNLQTFHSVTTCPIDRPSSTGPEEALGGKRWGFEPVSGYFNESQERIAMSTDPSSWPKRWPDTGWTDSWNGFFGKDLQNIQQESYYVMDDNNDEEFNYKDNNMWGVEFKPDKNNLTKNGVGLEMKVRGMQWQQFLAQDCLFWLYEVTNTGTTDYTKATFGMLVGTYVGVTGNKHVGESDDDWSFFDVNDDITYTGDYGNDVSRNPNWVGPVGMVGYAFLESPGNPFDGIDNDGDYLDYEGATFVPTFEEDDFDSTLISVGDKVILIDNNYERSEFIIPNQTTVEVQTLGKIIIINPGVTNLAEGNVVLNAQGDKIINPNAYDGIDNDLDGLIDENYYLHYRQRKVDQFGTVLFDILNPRAYIDYINNPNIDNTMIDERRDDGIDNDGDWDIDFDDVGADGISDTYDYGEGDGTPTAGEPNFDQTDVDESDQIGLTSFDYFEPASKYPWKDDEALWDKLRPGFFDTPDNISDGKPIGGSDGDFIYGSGYFPLRAGQTERLSLALVYGEDLDDLIDNKRTVQNIYNNNYRFPPPPQKPTLNAVAGNGKITLYWNRIAEEHADPITKQFDFQGYKLYRATDSNFNDVRNVTNAHGLVEGYRPIMQWDKNDGVTGYFYPSNELFQQTKGYSYYLGDDGGLVHSFVDKDVVNGRTYYYALVAYDHGDNDKNIFPSENSKFISVLPSGEIITDINTVVIIPTKKSLGYNLNSEIEVIHTTGPATGFIRVEIIDETSLTGHNYQVEFFDTATDGIDNDNDWTISNDKNNNGLPDDDDENIDKNDNDEYAPITTYYSVHDLTPITIKITPDDTLTIQLPYNNIIAETVLLKNSIGNVILENKYQLFYDSGKFRASFHDALGSDEHEISFEYYPIYEDPYIQKSPWDNPNKIPYVPETADTKTFDGIRLQFENSPLLNQVSTKTDYWTIAPIDSLTYWWTTDNGLNWVKNDGLNTYDVSVGALVSTIVGTPIKMPSDYIIVFSDNDEFGEILNVFALPNISVEKKSNFKIINTTSNLDVSCFLAESPFGRNGKIDPLETLYFYEKGDDNKYRYTWSIFFSERDTSLADDLNFGTGDTLFISMTKPFRKGDEFTFTTPVPEVNKELTKTNMNDIRVVPNPYIAANEFESPLPPGITSGRGERKVFFQNVPSDAKIYIFTSRGQHLRTLEHSGNMFTGTVTWDLKTKENLDIAYGVYFYIVDS
ncbi:MAG: hypothetical protein GWP19_06475, partial [Planctomycetia bacterium]|nr:hypothetical protein [Planctomycetia bacterium]